SAIGVLRVVLGEARGELARLLLVALHVAVGDARIEHLHADPRYLRGHTEAEVRLSPQRALVELRRQDGAHDAARLLDRHALAHAVRAAGPARVHQPDAGAGARDPLLQKARVVRGRPRHEGRAEAGAEGRLRRLLARFRARDLRGVAAQEVVTDLVARQP